MFYQKQPEMDVYFRMTKTGHNQVHTHLHGFFELHCCTEGFLLVTVDGKEYRVDAGKAVLIFPYQPHNYVRTGGNGYFFTFSDELIGTFSSHHIGMLPETPLFPFSYDFQSISPDKDIYLIKSFLYAMCSRADSLPFVSMSTEGRALLEKIFLLTEENFQDSEFTLQKLARLLDYDYGYISKYFRMQTGFKYNDYLNQRRIAMAVILLQKGEVKNISDVAFDCGYGSVRSFNRNFIHIEDKTPLEYLHSLKSAF